ncbi:MAG: LysM peptidoglycan-binding domain-containing protein [Anaerolineales bacterium]|nr:LysM peptidoglycan-binding domain-containing protein [Anaerolineales bacterium]
MQRILSLGLLVIVLAGILYACNIGGGGAPASPEAAFSGGDLPALTLAVQAQGGPFNTVGQTIQYQYTVTNSGGALIAGNVSITDNKATVSCPPTNTVGNLNDNLDPGESVACTSSYAITQADLNNGSVTSVASASAGGVVSNTVNTTVQMTLAKTLELTVVANPTTYNQAGQTVTFTYTIKNTGATALGPAQFVIHNDRLGNVNCGGADTTLAANASFSCTSTYTTSDSDRAANQLVFNLVASGGGATSIQSISVTITNTTLGGNPNYTRGATIQHDVEGGEWMLQIARCYGADFNAVRNANPQIKDPGKIWPSDVLTIPNIGSNGPIYGPPCVTSYTSQTGDTWNSIAQKYNADLNVLLAANKTVTLGGGVKLKIPLNSAGGSQPPVGNEPIRLTFPAGTEKVTRTGTVTVSRLKDRYVLTASQGQTLTLNLTASTGGLELAALAVNGTVLKPQNATLTWSGTIPANGDYYIDVVNVSASDRQYTLEIGLSTPTTATERVADINPGAGDSNPSYPAVFNNALYFNATGNDNAGAELWKYDAATNTASRVADIFPGLQGSNPAFLASYNGALYFSADGSDGAGVELWRFNGSVTGRLTDINTGAGNANPMYMTVYNNLLYFSATGSDGAGTELWQTDGVTAGRVWDIYSGDGSSNPAHLAVFNNALYFSAGSNDGAGTELWRYDGANVTRVTDINPGVGNSNPAYLAVFNNALYFSASDGTSGAELWKYDGTTASLAADINASGDSVPTYLTVFNNMLYFGANGNDGAGFELWRFNGTTASRVSDINKSGDSSPIFLVVYNNQLYFQANGNDGAGRELWRYKGP